MVAASGENASGPNTSRSGSKRIGAPPHGRVTRDRPPTAARQAISPRGVHAGKLIGALTRSTVADDPSAATVHNRGPSRVSAAPATVRPSGDHANWCSAPTRTVSVEPFAR
jgi:hypothetical protein